MMVGQDCDISAVQENKQTPEMPQYRIRNEEQLHPHKRAELEITRYMTRIKYLTADSPSLSLCPIKAGGSDFVRDIRLLAKSSN